MALKFIPGKRASATPSGPVAQCPRTTSISNEPATFQRPTSGIRPEGSSAPPSEPAPAPSCNLYVSGLPRQYEARKVTALFERFGPIFSVVVFKSRRAACVQFDELADAALAREALDGYAVTKKRTLSVRFANKSYTPQHPTPASPSTVASDSDSIGYTWGSSSDAGSAQADPDEVALDWLQSDLDDTTFEDERFEAKDFDAQGPPPKAAIQQANALLETLFMPRDFVPTWSPTLVPTGPWNSTSGYYEEWPVYPYGRFESAYLTHAFSY